MDVHPGPISRDVLVLEGGVHSSAPEFWVLSVWIFFSCFRIDSRERNTFWFANWKQSMVSFDRKSSYVFL
ncbi:unnamed protein product [Cuscuta campestris]|uniref:Uncharacterized protein n=1 Tax=Cuscuta campestris TaxID=132261 RepID=A0A484NLN5_9ASTE|nr:unnamed protein product [Cuscuta campestris]